MVPSKRSGKKIYATLEQGNILLHSNIHKRSLKAKSENSDCVVTRNISHFGRIPKDPVFPNSTSDESDDDFEYSRHNNNDNHNHNNRHYPLCNT